MREIRSLTAPDARGKTQARSLSVPAAIKRTARVRPNTFWDKTAYVPGVTETPEGPGQGKRTVQERGAFRAAHLELLDGTDDPALRGFCETWAPDRFADTPTRHR